MFATDSPQSEKLLGLLEKFAYGERSGKDVKNGWQLYTIAREAGLVGCYNVMSHILRMLRSEVTKQRTNTCPRKSNNLVFLFAKIKSEASRYWLDFLNLISDAEVHLVHSRLNDAVNAYIHAFKAFKAFQSMVGTRTSRAWFIQLRLDMINDIHQLLKVLDPSSEQLGDRRIKRMVKGLVCNYARYHQLMPLGLSTLSVVTTICREI